MRWARIQNLRSLGITLCFAVVLLTVSPVWSQEFHIRRETVFPSDTKDPPQVGAELLEAVCPGAVRVGKYVGCATGCSDATGFGKFGDRFPWTFVKVTLGHFLSAISDDAVLLMSGCEPHSENFGGTLLLTRKSGRWSVLWYKGGVETAKCHKIALHDGREILVCIGTYGAQGSIWTDLYVEDLLDPKPTLMAGNDGTFFETLDDTLTCGWQQGAPQPDSDPVIRSRIDKVEFSGDNTPLVSVTASFGTKRMTAEEVQSCMVNRGAFFPRMKTYRMEFVYDGRGFKPTPGSIETVRIFKGK